MGCFERGSVTRIALAAGTFAAIVAITASTASANVVIRTNPTFKTPIRQATAQHLGSANSAARHQFTVVLRDKSSDDARVVATYFRSFGLVVTESADKHFLHVAGTFGQAANAGRTAFEHVKVMGEEFIRTAHAPNLDRKS